MVALHSTTRPFGCRSPTLAVPWPGATHNQPNFQELPCRDHHVLVRVQSACAIRVASCGKCQSAQTILPRIFFISSKENARSVSIRKAAAWRRRLRRRSISRRPHADQYIAFDSELDDFPRRITRHLAAVDAPALHHRRFAFFTQAPVRLTRRPRSVHPQLLPNRAAGASAGRTYPDSVHHEQGRRPGSSGPFGDHAPSESAARYSAAEATESGRAQSINLYSICRVDSLARGAAP